MLCPAWARRNTRKVLWRGKSFRSLFSSLAFFSRGPLWSAPSTPSSPQSSSYHKNILISLYIRWAFLLWPFSSFPSGLIYSDGESPLVTTTKTMMMMLLVLSIPTMTLNPGRCHLWSGRAPSSVDQRAAPPPQQTFWSVATIVILGIIMMLLILILILLTMISRWRLSLRQHSSSLSPPQVQVPACPSADDVGVGDDEDDDDEMPMPKSPLVSPRIYVKKLIW